MSNKHTFIRSMTAAAAIFAAAMLVPAQAAGPVSTSGVAPLSRILVIDMRGVLMGSKVGQSVQKQAEQLKKQVDAQLASEAEGLKRERAQLEAQTAILNASIKAQKEAALRNRIQAFEQRAQERYNTIRGGMLKANEQINNALGPILQGIMQERQATILLDRASLLLAPNAIDITGVVVQRLDLKMPSVTVELVALPEGAGKSGARQPAAQ